MRIAWYSNAPWAETGYGTQTRQVIRRLADDGHDVAVLANHGWAAGVTSWQGIPVYPQGADGAYSCDVMVAHYMNWACRSADPCLLVTLFDVWPLQNELFDRVPVIASWVPIDHQPVPPKVAEWCRRPEVAPIAMAKFGQAELGRLGIESLYVPHAVDTSVFNPEADGAAWRAAYGIPEDAFVVCINAANKANRFVHRKAYPEMMAALGVFMRQHPDVWLFVHSLADRRHGGFDLAVLATVNQVPSERMRVVEQYRYLVGVPDTELAAMYAGSDVLLATSMGEGFGIPVIEAQACGTPVVVSNFSAQPELVGDGWLVEGHRWWDDPQGAWQILPDPAEIVLRLEEARARGRGRSVKAAEFAQCYDADHVYRTHWKPTLDQLEGRLHDLEALVP